MKRKPIIITILILVTAALLVAIWALYPIIVPPGHTPRVVRVGYIRYTADLAFFVADSEQFFDSVGLKVEPIFFPKSSACLATLVRGDIDAAMGNSLSSILIEYSAKPNSIRAPFILQETSHNFVSHLLVHQDSPMSQLEDLRGKRVATYSSSTQLIFLQLFLSAVGLGDEGAVSIVRLNPETQDVALKNDMCDALFTVEPYATLALAYGDARELLAYPRGRILDPFPAGAITFSERFISERPDDAQRLYEALARAIQFISRKPIEAKRILTKTPPWSKKPYTPLTEDLLDKTNLYEWVPAAYADANQIEALIRIMKESHTLSGDLMLRGEVSTEGLLWKEGKYK